MRCGLHVARAAGGHNVIDALGVMRAGFAFVPALSRGFLDMGLHPREYLGPFFSVPGWKRLHAWWVSPKTVYMSNYFVGMALLFGALFIFPEYRRWLIGEESNFGFWQARHALCAAVE